MSSEKCYYCGGVADRKMVCNDWGNIPLCADKKCFDKFMVENVSQFFVEMIK